MSYLIYIFVIVFLTLIDQLSKTYIASSMELYDQIEIIKDFFYITYVKNDGAGFSILKGQMAFFYIVTVIALIFLVYMLIKSNNKLADTAYLLMIGGALGNFIDRIRFKYVTDFLDFKIFGYDFPVFNLADTFLTIGVGLLILSILLEERHAKN